jgi:hypothetical protein
MLPVCWRLYQNHPPVDTIHLKYYASNSPAITFKLDNITIASDSNAPFIMSG